MRDEEAPTRDEDNRLEVGIGIAEDVLIGKLISGIDV